MTHCGLMRKEDIETHDRLARTHWWMRAKRRFVLDALRRFRARSPLLDFGCGSGVDLTYWARTFDAVMGVDADPLCRKIGAQRGVTIIKQLPTKPVQTIVTLDVIEHIGDDAGILKKLNHTLARGGLLIVNVPAFQWLWSQHDVTAGHARRYTRNELREKLGAAGFRVIDMQYWNTFLFLPSALVKKVGKGACDIREMNPVVNTLLDAVCRVEFICWKVLRNTGLGWLRLPFGTSVFAVARKD